MTSFLTAKTIIIKKTENGTQTIETTGRQIKMDNTIDFFKENCKNKNTTKATTTWMRHYKKWASENGQITNTNECY